MPKGKGAKGTTVTLKTAKKAVRMTPDGHRRLTLSNMGITIFPKCIFKMTNVDEVDLSRNLIQKIPDSIGNFSSLRWLDLHSNKLQSVPESIGGLVRLSHLNLANNQLTSAGLPSTLGSLSNLKSLNMGMNRLDSLPPTMAALDSLQELGLFDNLFIELPEFVTVLHNLSKLNIKRNPLSYPKQDGEKVKKTDRSLVDESSLCKTCLSAYKEHIERLAKGGGRRGKGEVGGVGRRGGGGDGTFEEKRRTYPELMVPNSVAKVNQDVWRVRQVEHRPINCCTR